MYFVYLNSKIGPAPKRKSIVEQTAEVKKKKIEKAAEIIGMRIMCQNFSTSYIY